MVSGMEIASYGQEYGYGYGNYFLWVRGRVRLGSGLGLAVQLMLGPCQHALALYGPSLALALSADCVLQFSNDDTVEGKDWPTTGRSIRISLVCWLGHAKQS